jgi:flagellar hook assembly protein FlgD
VTVHIYGKTGCIVRTLDCGYLEKGNYITKERAIFWDGKDRNGEKVSSGTYFYTLKTGVLKTTKKMILLK